VFACAPILALAMLCVLTEPAHAQLDTTSHFGVGVSFSPYWKSRDDLMVTVGLDDLGGKIEGSEFTIGMVRGSMRGGEWGVSFVRKPVKDTTTVLTDQSSDTFQCGTGCTSSFTFTSTTTTTFHDVYMQGIEVHWAPTFVTISNRVQVGMVVGGGIAVPEGTIDETFESVNVTTNTFNGQTTTNTTVDSDSFSSPAKEVMFGKVPLFKVEAQASVILAPGLKVRFAGGLNNPGMGFRIGGIYLFGVK
jgi:hypothetical protein